MCQKEGGGALLNREKADMVSNPKPSQRLFEKVLLAYLLFVVLLGILTRRHRNATKGDPSLFRRARLPLEWLRGRDSRGTISNSTLNSRPPDQGNSVVTEAELHPSIGQNLDHHSLDKKIYWGGLLQQTFYS